jgi:hypothetical protein
MNIEEFVNGLSEKVNNSPHSPLYISETSRNITNGTPISSDFQYIGEILNYAISLQNFNEAYLHIGINCEILGGSIYDQLDKPHYLISDFSNNPIARRSIKSWLQKSGYRPYLKRASGRVINILRNHSYFIYHKIGVCFLDQFSKEEDNIIILKLLENYLADRAVVIINSVDSKDRINTIYSWLESTPNAKLLFDLPSQIETDTTQWRNIYVIAYERKKERY